MPQSQVERTPCLICGRDPGFRWCDHHGIGACLQCGAPYRIYHYDGEGDQKKRVDKPPELLIKSEWLEWTKAYWRDVHRNVSPGAFNMPGSSYEVATREDVEALDEWAKSHKHLEPLPPRGGDFSGGGG